MKFLIFTAMIVMILGATLAIYEHEQAHVEIFKHSGVDSEVDYFNWNEPFIAMTIPDKNCPDDVCRLSNNINEAVGYNLQGMYLIIGVGMFIVIIFLYIMYSSIEDLYELIERRTRLKCQ